MRRATSLIRTVRPLGYSIPMDGPVGALVQAQGRHGMRPAHIHFLVSAPGYRELVTALYVKGDAHIADDVVFGSSAGSRCRAAAESDPACPLKGIPSMRFDLTLSRESAVDQATGRVGADPAAIFKEKTTTLPRKSGQAGQARLVRLTVWPIGERSAFAAT